MDEILELTWRQVNILLDAKDDLEKSPKLAHQRNIGVKNKGIVVNDPMMLLNMPGFKLTDRAKKALVKMAGIKEKH